MRTGALELCRCLLIIVAGNSGVSVRGPFARFANVSWTAWGIAEPVPNEPFRTVRKIADQKVPLLPALDLEGLDSPGLPVHWHDHNVHAYLIEGTTDFFDAETGIRYDVGPGDKVVIPARSTHAEGEITDRVVYILGFQEPRPTDLQLVQQPPADL